VRNPIIVANWKMFKTVNEALAYIDEFLPLVKNSGETEVVLAPPFTALRAAAAAVAGSRVTLAGQNLHWEADGAFTGEISAAMLADAGCSYVIIGHSERRQYFGETDETVNLKIKAAIEAGLKPIVCVGESLEDREAGQTLNVIRRQVNGALTGLKKDHLDGMVLAYEPIWAIGTGLTATPEQAGEVHGWIREMLAAFSQNGLGQAIRIQYGGSVKPGNINDLMAQPDIDGALVGGASLKPDSFSRIVNFR
jgi:triosephosphate isomerase